MKFIVDKEFFNKVPNAYFGVIIAKNIDNSSEYEFIKDKLEEQLLLIKEEYKDMKAKELPKIILYREAFELLGINPNKFMCSIESLVGRTIKSGFIPHINPLVDLGNALSLKYMIPIGIHDIDKLAGDIEIRFANSSDKFLPFGSSEVETPDEGEVIYVSGNDVRTRRWTWRQGENGKINHTVKNAFIPLDGFLENKESLLKL
ncbi:MAG: phenylalanine--tRNA ligase beta subunit-related protein [Bacilli bacterium]|nr:phenylalanine--tRNA ligase beta subunit-related protein [Bacilli bacterium]MDD4808523.1 phenylalanine--tRNA ligase beta subunit-related protein [Bacilli bacterium]